MSLASLFRVYPRACGGTAINFSDQQRQLGLSPRVRGNLGQFVNVAGVPGSIPARAGEPASDWP